MKAQLALACALISAPAASQEVSGAWNYHFQQGIGQYLTGEWDSPTGAALNLSCLQNGNVSVMPQIKGKGPPGGSRFTLTASSRSGTKTHSFQTGEKGNLTLRADSPAFRELWGDLRKRDIVTLRYADGQFQVLSLDGAMKLLPPKPCG